jgi:hypothetical protein
MKPYGNSRIQNRACKYGCCSFGTCKTNRRGMVTVHPALVRRSRKAARRLNRHLSREAE